MEIVLPAPGKQDTTLYEWFNSRGVQSGRIVLELTGDAKNNAEEKQVLFFEDAICFSLSEEYDLNTSRRYAASVTKLCKRTIHTDPDLILKGLMEVYFKNA